MKQLEALSVVEVFHISNLVLRLTFKTMDTRDNCAILAVENHQLAMNLVISRGQSDHFWKEDCFDCLSPHKIAV